jgi:hypothetical protein
MAKQVSTLWKRLLRSLRRWSIRRWVSPDRRHRPAGRLMSRDESPMDEEVIPGHILNLICAIHLRQDHGYKAWTTARFEAHFQALRTGDGGFEFTALHVLHHTRVGSIVQNDLGLEVADLRVDPGDADHLPHR